METDNKRLLSFLDNAVAVSLAITVMSAEVSVAVSSIATGFMIVLAAFRLSIGRNVTLPEKGLFMVFGLWIFAQFLATVFSVHPLESLDNSRKLPLILVFFTAIIFIKSFGQLRLMLASLFVFTALVSLYELILFNEIWFSRIWHSFLEVRISYFTHHITTGEMKMLVLMLIFSFILSEGKPVLNRYLLLAIAVPVLLSLYYTGARNAIFASLAGLASLGIMLKRDFLIIMFALLAIFIIVPIAPWSESLVSSVDFSSQTMQSRVKMWETGMKIFADHPLTGIGDINFDDIYPEYSSVTSDAELMHMHSNFINILCTHGLVGFTAWIGMMAFIIKRQAVIFRSLKTEKTLRTLAAASLASMIAFQVSGLTEYNFGDHEVIVLAWFCFGLAFLADKFSNEKLI